MKYYSEDIEKLNNSLKIEEVVGEVVELKKTGANYKGVCPFHPDTNPSFSVSPSKNICKCFVCGAGGGPVKFYSMYNKISFQEAIKELSKKYNIPVREYASNKTKEKEDLKYYQIMRDTHDFYKNKIFENEGRDALEYLTKRSVSPKIIKENELGFAPNNWGELYDFLIERGYQKEDILSLGLVKENEKGYYDSFRNRIIFPIYSVNGEIIAFGGRTLETGKEIPKYINSSDTPIFKKGKNLYGIKEKGKILRKKNYAILMEGYMDVLSAHSFGFDVALASLGTAFTYEQGELLKRYTNNVILSLDMDSAGQMATEKTAIILKNLGFNIRVLKLKNAKDPDEFLKKYGKDEFLKSVKNSLEIFDFLYEIYSREYDLSNIMSKKNFLERFKEFFKNIESSLERSLYLDKLSESLEIDKKILKDILINDNLYIKMNSSEEYFREEKRESKEKIDILEELTLELIISNVEYYDYFYDKKIESNLGKKMFYFFDEVRSENKKMKLDLLREFVEENSFSEEEKKLAFMFGYRALEFSDENKRKELLYDIFKSWFLKEIKDVQKLRINIMLMTVLKKIENKVRGNLTFEELSVEYSNLKKFLIENNLL